MKNNITFNIKGMHCANCENLIERKLGALCGVKRVIANFRTSRVFVEFDQDVINQKEIEHRMEELNYEVISFGKINRKKNWLDVLSVIIIIACIYLIGNRLGLTKIFYYFPMVRQGTGYGILFVIGLLTSVHCISMCGGINMTQSIYASSAGTSVLKCNLMYNLGRVASYTLIGGVIGFVGSVIGFSGRLKGAVAILAGIFMLIMGLNMLNVFPWLRKLNIAMPRKIQYFFQGTRGGKSSFYIGLANGFMPCGPLQSMQLYALSTGSFWYGALSMFLFSTGTVPLMFGFGVLAGKLNKKVSSFVFQISAILVIVLGVGMLNNGLALSGVIFPGESEKEERKIALLKDGYQIVQTELNYGSYEPIEVKKGIPVRFVIHVEEEKINGCNNEITIPEYNITKGLTVGDNIIEFLPVKEGIISYSCWMGMIRSSILVTE